MSLDSTARESNVRDSLIKFFVDNLKTQEGVSLSFDKSLSAPKIQGNDVDRWVMVDFGPMDRATVSEHYFDLYCCTRKDPQGFRLAQLGDSVMGYLTDTTQTDGIKRIPFYKSKESGAWDLLGSLLVTEVREGKEFDAPDGTKVKILSVLIKWAAIV
jgi:hypothetical protein